jgi:hypothetical protein
MDICEICSEDVSEAGKLQRLYRKGYENITKQCRLINNSSLLERLEQKWSSNTPMTVHRRCRTLFMQKEPDVEEQEHAPRPKRKKVSQAVNDDKVHGKIK